MYSLWRGEVMLGRITPELPSDNVSAIAGVLQPTASFTPEMALVQHTMDALPGAPVWQHPVPLTEASGAAEGAFEVGARILSEAELRGVTAEQMLELRDETGQPVPTDLITVMEMHVGNVSGVHQLCAAASVPFSGWYLVAGLAGSSRHAL